MAGKLQWRLQFITLNGILVSSNGLAFLRHVFMQKLLLNEISMLRLDDNFTL